MAYMKHIVLYHWSLCACIVIGCVIRVYIGSCVATSQSGYLILYFVRTYVTVTRGQNAHLFLRTGHVFSRFNFFFNILQV